MTHYEFHEYANIFPMLEGEELEALRADMDANGQINKIILYLACAICYVGRSHPVRLALVTRSVPGRYEETAGALKFP